MIVEETVRFSMLGGLARLLYIFCTFFQRKSGLVLLTQNLAGVSLSQEVVLT